MNAAVKCAPCGEVGAYVSAAVIEVEAELFPSYVHLVPREVTCDRNARDRFFRAYQESGFLFTKESGIEALLKMLNDEGMKVIGFKENSDMYKSDPNLMIEQFEKTNDIQLRIFNEGLENLKAAMHQHLDFSKVL